ncbi:MAG: Acid-resistance rane protein [Nitrososphaeraceae archaeon]|jgi:uncharacterized membrane protein HdeD (DUF308 family)|nr:Acid-resistance rane protein [Nitrososphaeraceae archaeon]MDF2769241.1 Acid-resistance rane protein [Nitrososphaeraceae archaeon]
MSSQKSPGWRRAAQIGLGALAIILAIIAMVFPGATVVSIVIILAIALLIVGIEKVISGIFFVHKSRFAAIGLGILVIILAIIALAFPVGATTVLILIIAFALMFDGFARIIQGFGDKQERGWIRGFYIGVGVLAVIISVMILVSPFFGAALAGLLIGIALLIIGIQVISAGIAGREARLRPSMT